MKRLVALTTLAVGLLGAACAPGGGEAQLGADDPGAPELKADGSDDDGTLIRAVTWSGPGCPTYDSVQINLHDDRRIVSATFTEMGVSLAQGDSAAQDARACHLSIELDAPMNYTFALMHVNLHGEIDLAPGVAGKMVASYHGPGGQGPVLETPFTGPLSTPYLRRDAFSAGGIDWLDDQSLSAVEIDASVVLSRGVDGDEGGSVHLASLDFVIDQSFF